MRDINLQLRQKYYEKINGQITIEGEDVPVYYLFVPEGYPKFYIVVQSINSTGQESKNDQDRQTTIQFLISSRLKNNSGFEVDQIADQLLNLVYPNRNTIIEGCLSMELVSDLTIPDYDPQGKKQIVERNIIFSHIISS